MNQNHRFLTTPVFAMGQTMEGAAGPWINETATRARAGLLNIISGVTMFIPVAWPATFGSTTICPDGRTHNQYWRCGL